MPFSSWPLLLAGEWHGCLCDTSHCVRQTSYWELQSTRYGASDGRNESFPPPGATEAAELSCKAGARMRPALGGSYAVDNYVHGCRDGGQFRESACVRTVLFA